MGAEFLISRLSSLGDVVCSLPVASALKATHPDCRITWVVDNRFAAVVEACSAVDEVVAIRPSFKKESWPKFDRTYDIAFDIQGLLKSAAMVGMAKAKEKLGYHWQREGAWLFSRPVLPAKESVHVVEQYLDVARAAGASSSEVRFALAPVNEASAKVVGLLIEEYVGQDFVVVNAGAAWATKRWPPSHFAAIIDKLAAKGIQSVMIGTPAPSDREAADDVANRCQNRPIDLLGKTSIAELIALVSRAKAHIGGDTGSSHIAAALGVPAVGLYSITRPERSCPYGQFHRAHYDSESLANISPDAVFETLEEAIA